MNTKDLTKPIYTKYCSITFNEASDMWELRVKAFDEALYSNKFRTPLIVIAKEFDVQIDEKMNEDA